MYAKVFSSLFDGSMRGQPDLILVFINMLTRCDSDGCVDRTPRVISDETGLPVERVKEAIKMLESPDPESRTPDMEGRRIVLVSDERTWGWQIVNFRKYRGIRDEQSRQQQNREAQQRYKSKQGKPESAKVSQEKPDKPQSAHTEAEAEAHTEADTETDNRYRAASVPLADASKMLADSKSDFESFWKAYPKKKSKGVAIKAFSKAMKITTLDVILTSLKNLSGSADWIKEGGKYIPHPSTWLNAQGWEDQVLLNFSKSGLPVPSQEELKAMGPKWGTNRAE